MTGKLGYTSFLAVCMITCVTAPRAKTTALESASRNHAFMSRIQVARIMLATSWGKLRRSRQCGSYDESTSANSGEKLPA
jgi:hypothetical protein